MKRLLAIFLVLLPCCESSDKPQLSLTNEQAVYESVALTSINSMSKEIVVLNKTNVIWFQEKSLEKIKKFTNRKYPGEAKTFNAPEILIDRIHASNQKIHGLNWNPIIVNGRLEAAEKHAPFKKGPLKETYSYYSFSRAAFSNDKKHALVKFTYHCHALCGGEWLVYLIFEENQWKVTQTLTIWIS